MERENAPHPEIVARVVKILEAIEAAGLPIPSHILIPPCYVVEIEQIRRDTQIEDVLHEAAEAADRRRDA